MESTLLNLFEKICVQCEETNTLNDFQTYLNAYYDVQKSRETKQKFMRKIVDDFNSNNMIYFNKTSKIYYNYIDNNYLLLNEDNMLHHILYFISNFKHEDHTVDLSLKTNIKQKILKSIKENSVYDTIPDTDTIQNVLNVCVPNIFDRKEYAKIFLLSLGSIILKKQSEQKTLIFMRNQIKPFLNEINKCITMYFSNNNVFNTFKFKYTQDHISSVDKLVIPCKSFNMDMFSFPEQFYVNLICVCVYYSNRYDSVDNYLQSVIEDVTHVERCVNYFHHNTKESVAQYFADKYFIKNANESMEPKELLFLWKQYNEQEDMFVHVFTSHQDFLITLFETLHQTYDETNNNNRLQGYYSMEIPTIQLFREFWDKHFVYCENEYYFEISEILHLFHQAHKQKKTNLSETTIKLILQLYYDTHTINKGKIIHNLKCTFWDKQKEIDDFITKENINIKQNIHTLYKKYCIYEKNLKIGKKYFTMYLEKKKSDLK